MTEKKIKEAKEDDIKRLYRSKEDKMISGVAGGIAEYLKVDSVWVRLVFFISIFFNGIGLLAYLILWVLIPDNPYQEEPKKNSKTKEENHKTNHSSMKTNNSNNNNHSRLIVGSILIFIGIIFMLKEFFKIFDWTIFWAAFFIGIGIILLIRRE